MARDGHGPNTVALLRTTVAAEPDARRLARRCIESGVACCVHIVPMSSVYRWEGKVVEEAEWLVEARTTPQQADALWAALLDGHPYETPMVERLADARTTARYAAWARSVTTG